MVQDNSIFPLDDFIASLLFSHYLYSLVSTREASLVTHLHKSFLFVLYSIVSFFFFLFLFFLNNPYNELQEAT